MDKLNKINFFSQNQIEKVNLTGNISVENVGSKSFKDTMGDMLLELNEITNKPEKLTNDFVQGNADIHDVLAAVAKSELTVQAAATVTGKILQTYEKIMQIQI